MHIIFIHLIKIVIFYLVINNYKHLIKGGNTVSIYEYSAITPLNGTSLNS